MEGIIKLLNVVLPVLYFYTTYLYAIFFFREQQPAGQKATRMLHTTIAVHIVEIILRGVYYRHFPVATVWEAFSVIALAVALIYAYVEYRSGNKTTGYYILIFVFFIQLFSSAFFDTLKGEFPPFLTSSLFIFHVSSAILGYSSFIISAIYGLMYLMLFHEIKQSHFGIIYRRLPSLEELSEMNVRAANIGLFFLTLAIILGLGLTGQVYVSFSPFDAKAIITYIAWFIYALVVYGKVKARWPGRVMALLSLGGLAVILFSMLVVNLFMSNFHEFK